MSLIQIFMQYNFIYLRSLYITSTYLMVMLCFQTLAFAQTHTINTVVSGGFGSIQPYGQIRVAHGGNQTFDIAPLESMPCNINL